MTLKKNSTEELEQKVEKESLNTEKKKKSKTQTKPTKNPKDTRNHQKKKGKRFRGSFLQDYDMTNKGILTERTGKGK